MPGGDRTGPLGMGPGTGRGGGYCSGYDGPGSVTRGGFRGFVAGLGRGRGFWRRGGGFGWRNWFHATGQPGWMRYGASPVAPSPYAPETEKRALEFEAEALQAELDTIKRRLEALEKGAGTE